MSPIALTSTEVEEFITGYVTCALWADCLPTEEDGETGGCEDLELRDGAREKMGEDCRAFCTAEAGDLQFYAAERSYFAEDGSVWEHAGHDFWLTRNGHGAGFWDRGLGALGDRLADAARCYGSPDDHTPYDCGDGTADA